MAKPEKTSLLDALQNVTEADLVAIDARMVDLQKQFNEQTAELRKQIDALKVARAVVDVQLHGKAKRVVKRRSASGGARSEANPTDIASRMFDLITAEGPLPCGAIATRLGVAPQAVGVSARHSGWFEKTREGDYAIAKR